MPDRCLPPDLARPDAAGTAPVEVATVLGRLCRSAEREISLLVRSATYIQLRPQITELTRRREMTVCAVVHHDTQPSPPGADSGCDVVTDVELAGDGPTRLITVRRPLDRELVLIDRRRALVLERPVTPPRPGRTPRGLVVTEPLAVRALHDLVLNATGLAPQPTEESDAAAPTVAATDIDVLHCLADGNSDERAADQLGLSVRTYRRRVARLMRELRAQTRFQAALKARNSRLI